MNYITSMLTRAKQSTSPVIALFTWAAVWVFSTEQPMQEVILFIDKTDPLKLGFGAVLVIGSLFLGWRPNNKTIEPLPPLPRNDP